MWALRKTHDSVDCTNMFYLLVPMWADELLNNNKLDHSLETMQKYAILINLHLRYSDITLNIEIENETNSTFKCFHLII